MLSIGIPTYNYDPSPLLDKLLLCKKATTEPIEILVLDDASTTFAIEKCKEKYRSFDFIRFSENILNKGRTATRSEIATKAVYNWILFLDADVIPESNEFVINYLTCIDGGWDIITGGISYEKVLPDDKVSLRWKYGRLRETKSAKKRQLNPYFLVSANLLIKRETFLKINETSLNAYGSDNIFSATAKKEGLQITHINNPVIHLGLESNTTFLNKTLRSVDTLKYFEEKDIIPKNFTSLQQAAHKLKNTYLHTIFLFLTNPFLDSIKKNLLGKKPSLFLLDMYKLNYYLDSKEDKNA